MGVRAAVAVVGGVSLAATALAGPAATAVPAGAEGRIAYVANVGGNLEIFSRNPDGSEVRNLTEHTARDQDPVWSPDGSRIAFSSNRDGAHMDLWVMDADGSDLVNLTPWADTTVGAGTAVEPTWSPDGSQIAFAHQGDVWVTSAAAPSGSTNLTHDPNLAAAGSMPSWSPSGDRIAYIRDWNIWTMSPDGSDKQQLTFTTGGLGTEKYPEWSPDGLRIVYERSGQIWQMNADGTGQTPVSAGADRGGTRPTWSPEGDWLVFSSSGYAADNEPDLVIVRPDGRQARTLHLDAPFADHDPSWQAAPVEGRRSTYLAASATLVEAEKRIDVGGELFDAHPGESVHVTLEKKLGKKPFRAVKAQELVLDTFGDYATSLGVPRRADRCRVVASYAGSPVAGPSSRTFTFGC